MLECENCGTEWFIHKLGVIPKKDGPLIIPERPCLGEWCPGCMGWLDIKSEIVVTGDLNVRTST